MDYWLVFLDKMELSNHLVANLHVRTTLGVTFHPYVCFGSRVWIVKNIHFIKKGSFRDHFNLPNG